MVEIYSCNYNIEDGIVNGFDGIFKLYSKKDNNNIVWIKFNDTNIGQQQRKKYTTYYNNEIHHEWVPIFRIARPILRMTSNKNITIRKQFPIQLTCARTIHRSQGLTMETLAFDPTGVK